MPVEKVDLKLHLLGQGITALTPQLEVCFGHAAAVCLEERGHRPGINMKVAGIREAVFGLEWPETTDQVRNSWEDREKSTEYGAYGIAVLLLNSMTNLKACRISRKNNGFDFWMTEMDATEPFQDAARLEVTGIRSGTPSDIGARLKGKVDRLKRYPNPLAAFVVVVEFGAPQSVVQQP